jgi:hypothetical protein
MRRTIANPTQTPREMRNPRFGFADDLFLGTR